MWKVLGFVAEIQTERKWVEKRDVICVWKVNIDRKMLFSCSASPFSSLEPCLLIIHFALP